MSLAARIKILFADGILADTPVNIIDMLINSTFFLVYLHEKSLFIFANSSIFFSENVLTRQFLFLFLRLIKEYEFKNYVYSSKL